MASAGALRTFGATSPLTSALGSRIEMKTRHYFSVPVIAASIVLTVIGFFSGASVLVGLATAIELVASIVSQKKTNT